MKVPFNYSSYFEVFIDRIYLIKNQWVTGSISTDIFYLIYRKLILNEPDIELPKEISIGIGIMHPIRQEDTLSITIGCTKFTLDHIKSVYDALQS